LGVSKRHIDRTLRLLEDFGPAYFQVAQMAHLSPEEYKAIATHVGPEGVRVDGAVIALLPENSEQVSAAVAELVRRERPPKRKPIEAPAEAFLLRVEELATAIADCAVPLDPPQKVRLSAAVGRAVEACARKVA